MMKSIRTQCKNLDTFYDVANKHLRNSAYMLGNLYALQKNAKPQEVQLIQHSIKSLQQKMSDSFSVEKLWDCMSEHSQKRLLTRGNQRSLRALRIAMLNDSFYFCKIADCKLIDVGTQINFTQRVMIALIRKDSLSKGLADPFNNFDYAVLSQSDSRQNHRYLYDFIKNNETLPHSIVQLSKRNPAVANIVLKNFASSAHFFKLSAKIADKHPSLRIKIAKKWQQKCATFPIDSQQYSSVSLLLTSLKRKYPEFKDVSLKQRPLRNYPTLDNRPFAQTNITDEFHEFLTEHSTEIKKRLAVGGVACCLQPQATPLVVGIGALSLTGAFAWHCMKPRPAIRAPDSLQRRLAQ